MKLSPILKQNPFILDFIADYLRTIKRDYELGLQYAGGYYVGYCMGDINPLNGLEDPTYKLGFEDAQNDLKEDLDRHES